MATELHMPALDLTGEEIRVMRWKRREGDAVAAGAALLEVETEKATLDVIAPQAGTLLKIMAAEGAVVEVGDILCYIGEPGEVIPWLAAGADRAAPAAAEAYVSPAIPAPADSAPAAPLIN